MDPSPAGKPTRPFKARPDDVDVLEMDMSQYNERLMTVLPAMVEAIGGVVQKYKVTHKEYQVFRDFITQLAAGPFGTIGGMSDAWLERLFDHTGDPNWRGTRAQPEGPLYARGVPRLDPPPTGKPYVLYRRPDEPGQRLLVSGKVLSLAGEPISGAELDIWHAADNGLYSTLGFDPSQPEWNLRGRILAGEDGSYEFLTIKPPPYNTPGIPDTLYDLFSRMGKAHFRPAHIHIRVSHPDVSPDFFTQLYFKGDPYLEYDVGLVDSRKLRFEVGTCDNPKEIARLGLEGPFRTLHCDLRIETKQDHRVLENA